MRIEHAGVVDGAAHGQAVVFGDRVGTRVDRGQRGLTFCTITDVEAEAVWLSLV